MMIIVSGLPGSGKSYFAENLAIQLGAAHISSDRERNSMGARGRYSYEQKLSIYNAMARKTRQLVESGKHVVVDATFYRSEMIDLFKGVAKECRCPIWFIKIEANDDLIRERIRKPRKDSEANYDVYLKIKDQFEKLKVPHLILRSRRNNIKAMLSSALEYIGQRHE
jgi:predicted kinase